MSFDGFPKDTLQFLSELSENNDRDWFAENKQRYEEVFVEPSLAFIEAMEKPLKKISPFLVAIPKKQGGSLMRIYRDVRFSKNKQPYKTNIGINFRHEAGKNVHAPGLYVHLSPGEVFIGSGMWRPDRDPLNAIREAIDADAAGWKRATRSKKFTSDWTLVGESLKRAPAAFEPDHPMIDDIKRKDFIGACDLKPGDETKADFLDTVIAKFKTSRPLLQFLGDAVGMPC